MVVCTLLYFCSATNKIDRKTFNYVRFRIQTTTSFLLLSTMSLLYDQQLTRANLDVWIADDLLKCQEAIALHQQCYVQAHNFCIAAATEQEKSSWRLHMNALQVQAANEVVKHEQRKLQLQRRLKVQEEQSAVDWCACCTDEERKANHAAEKKTEEEAG